MKLNRKITKRAIESMKYNGPAPRRDIRWDGELPTFGIRIYPSGRKAFIVYYRVNGRKRLFTLGDYPNLTTDKARHMARDSINKAEEGHDPLEIKQKRIKGETISDLCEMYIERHSKPNKKSSKDDERRISQHILPAFGIWKVQDVKRPDISRLHSKIGINHPYEANRILSLLGKMFELAKRWGQLEEGAANPARNIDRFKEVKRDRWITEKELPKLAEAIDQEENIYVRSGIWLYLLTGLRKGELLKAKWQDVDLDRKELKIPETKAGRVHYVPLSEEAMAILRELPIFENNPFVLPGYVEGNHLQNIDKPWRRIRKAAGIEDARLHDLRRTLGSWLAQAGNSLHLIGRVLNHSNTSTTAIYARFGQDNVRDALDAHGKRIMGAAGKRPKAEVVELKKANKR